MSDPISDTARRRYLALLDERDRLAAEVETLRAQVADWRVVLTTMADAEGGCCYTSWESTCADQGDEVPCVWCLTAAALARYPEENR